MCSSTSSVWATSFKNGLSLNRLTVCDCVSMVKWGLGKRLADSFAFITNRHVSYIYMRIYTYICKNQIVQVQINVALEHSLTEIVIEKLSTLRCRDNHIKSIAQSLSPPYRRATNGRGGTYMACCSHRLVNVWRQTNSVWTWPFSWIRSGSPCTCPTVGSANTSHSSSSGRHAMQPHRSTSDLVHRSCGRPHVPTQRTWNRHWQDTQRPDRDTLSIYYWLLHGPATGVVPSFAGQLPKICTNK